MDALREWWAVIGGGIGLIAWALPVESNTKANAAEIRRLWRQREEDQQSHRESRGTTLGLLDELRRDIKTLLSRRDG